MLNHYWPITSRIGVGSRPLALIAAQISPTSSSLSPICAPPPSAHPLTRSGTSLGSATLAGFGRSPPAISSSAALSPSVAAQASRSHKP
jgi:hypothetical protein